MVTSRWSLLAAFSLISFSAACTSTGDDASEPTPAVEEAPVAAEEATPDERLDNAIQIALGTVYFEFDSSALTPQAMENLKAMANALKALSDTKLLIEGHADERGSNEYNLALAQKRADAIKEFLLSEGVSEAVVQTASYGEERPAAEGHSEEAYAKNRRGEFKRLD